MTTTVELGKRGEALAASYLLGKQYQILSRNFRSSRGEVDIIARRDDILVFIEVKTAHSNSHGDPLERVGRQKQRRVIHAARYFLNQTPALRRQCDIRFDVIAIYPSNGTDEAHWGLEHIVDAFRTA